MKDMTPIEISRRAMKIKDIKGDEFMDFRNFYTSGDPERMFVPVSDYIEWKGLRVKSELNPDAFAQREWTYAYREVAANLAAASDYDKKIPDIPGGKSIMVDESVVKKNSLGFLLFDLKFLIAFFDDAAEILFHKKLYGKSK